MPTFDSSDPKFDVFRSESLEQLESAEKGILSLEEMGSVDDDLINSVFRDIHSIKGGAMFLGMSHLANITHVMENVLDELRKKTLEPSGELYSLLLQSIDLVKDIFASPDDDFSKECEKFKELFARATAPKGEDSSDSTAEDENVQDVEHGVEGAEVESELEDAAEIALGAESEKEEQVEFVEADGATSDESEEQVDEEDIPTQLDCASESDSSLSDGSNESTEESSLDSGTEQVDEPIQMEDAETTSSETGARANDDTEQVSLPSLPTRPDSFGLSWDGDRWVFEIPGKLLKESIGRDCHVYLAKVALDERFEGGSFEDRLKRELEEYTVHHQVHKDEVGNTIWVCAISLLMPPVFSKLIGLYTPDFKEYDAHTVDSLVNDLGEVANQCLLSEKDMMAAPEPKAPSYEPPQDDLPAVSAGSTMSESSMNNNGADDGDNSEKAVASGKSTETIRVDVQVLDKLMTAIGELVLTRNQLIQIVENYDKGALEATGQRLDGVTYELQESIMATRMQPVGNVFGRFKRVIRDLSRDLNKDINLELEGEELEMDKTIIEAIGDPLTHLVRNAIDHGLEQKEERIKAGKSVKGRVKLKAYHAAGQMMIDISDDGKGIDVNVIKKKALEKGLYNQADLEGMTESDALAIIFMPGFSTAEKLSDISGRGVGMDVVSTNIKKLGGSIDIETEVGKGTTFHVKLPLTLTIVPSLIVKVEQERFAIPQVNLIELVRIPPNRVKERLEKVGDAVVIRLRGKLLPLINLRDFLQIESPTYKDPETGERKPDRRVNIADRRSGGPVEEKFRDMRKNEGDRRYHIESSLCVMVVRSSNLDYGIVVEELLDNEEIVVKPLGHHLRECKGYAGATILGDGSVALILDVVEMSKVMELQAQQKLVTEVKKEQKAAEDAYRSGRNKQFLIVENNYGLRCAVPLEMVWRIDRICKNDLKNIGEQILIPYGEKFTPVTSIDEIVEREDSEEGVNYTNADKCYVLIFPIQGKEVGVLVARIVDAVSSELEIDTVTFQQNGVMGTVSLMDELTIVLDLHELFLQGMPHLGNRDGGSFVEENVSKTILLCEDSNFFLKRISEFLIDNGYTVIAKEDGALGYETFNEQKSEIDLILSDIEMPNLDGISLAKKIRGDGEKTIPMLALTSLTGEEIRAKILEAGFDDYMVKLDREEVLSKVAEMIK